LYNNNSVEFIKILLVFLLRIVLCTECFCSDVNVQTTHTFIRSVKTGQYCDCLANAVIVLLVLSPYCWDAMFVNTQGHGYCLVRHLIDKYTRCVRQNKWIFTSIIILLV